MEGNMDSEVQQPIVFKDHTLLVPTDSSSILTQGTESVVEGESAKAAKPTLLPEEVLQIIFKCVLDDNPPDKALLDWRLVGWSWKNAVDNYPILMDNYWWIVSNIREFLNSSIATKVKNLRFVRGRRGVPAANQEQMDTFFNEIIPNVERIMFDFPEMTNQFEDVAERKLFTNLMSTAKNLKEIRIKTINRQFLRAFSYDKMQHVLRKVRHLSFNIQRLDLAEIQLLKNFLFIMPQLKKIELFDGDDPSMQMSALPEITTNLLTPYFDKFPGSLKELSLKIRELKPHMIKTLLLLTMKHQVEVNFGGHQYQAVELCDFFEEAEKSNIVLNDYNCSSLKNGKSYLHTRPNPGEIARKVGFCTKLEELDIMFDQTTCAINELNFLPRLKYLNYLHLTHYDNSNGIANIPSSPDSIFLPGIPSLDHLVITNINFNSYSNFDIYFPNLTKLWLGEMSSDNIHVDILVSLGKMRNLENMLLYGSSFTDEMFTKPCEVADDDENGSIIIVPAIATFKRLRSLNITRCNLLTDVCLIDGIVHNQTLECLTLDIRTPLIPPPNPQFSDVVLNEIAESGIIITLNYRRLQITE